MGRRDRRPGACLPAVAFLALLLIIAHAVAAAPDAPVAVDVGVVVASNEGNTMDPALTPLRNQLHSMFTYSSYQLVDRLKRTLSVGETGDFALPGKRSMRVTPVPAKAGEGANAARNAAVAAIAISFFIASTSSPSMLPAGNNPVPRRKVSLFCR